MFSSSHTEHSWAGILDEPMNEKSHAYFAQGGTFITNGISIVASCGLWSHTKNSSNLVPFLIVDLNMGSFSNTHDIGSSHGSPVLQHNLFTFYIDDLTLRL